VLFEEEHDLAGAEASYRRSDERRNPHAAFNLGALLHERGYIESHASSKTTLARGDVGGIPWIPHTRAARGGTVAPVSTAPERDYNYREYVGPGEEYDLMSATQFGLLCALGLRENHRLLDIGCGSLRGGRLFIPYLAPGGYTGLEPNRWLVEEAIDEQLGRDLVALKRPTFLYNDQFALSALEPFDFVLAQSIASHSGPAMTRALLGAVAEALAPTGIAAVTFVHGKQDCTEEGWFYKGTARPGPVMYRRATIEGWINAAGMRGTPLAWFHPRQTWWAMVQQGTPLPPRRLRVQARGPMLPYEESWKPPTHFYLKTCVPRWQRQMRMWKERLRRTLGLDSVK
jgi:hypothetical protein